MLFFQYAGASRPNALGIGIPFFLTATCTVCPALSLQQNSTRLCEIKEQGNYILLCEVNKVLYCSDTWLTEILSNQEDTDGQPRPPQNHKPPAIFIHGIINYGEMIKRIRYVAEDEQYCTKSLSKNVIKLNCTTPETYRNHIKYFKVNNIFYHTYQLKEE